MELSRLLKPNVTVGHSHYFLSQTWEIGSSIKIAVSTFKSENTAWVKHSAVETTIALMMNLMFI